MSKEHKHFSREYLSYLFPLLFAIVLVVGILIGVLVGGTKEVKTSFFTRADHDKVEEILNYVNNRYVDSVDGQELFNMAVDEIFRNLDPHSVYITAETLKSVNESLEGTFEGIGVEFFLVSDTIVVVTTIDGGPSEKAGIFPGDKIVMIEDTVVAGISITNRDVIGKLKGPKGSQVKVAVLRQGKDTLLNYNIVRGSVKLTSVDAHYMMDNEVGYVKISKFSSTTDKEFIKALDDLNKRGMKRLVLDLRDNGGGYLDAATNVADELLDGRKLIVYTEGRAYPKKKYRAHKDGGFEEGALVIMVNENSASASEILAGAIQDWNRGTIMGRRTYGKALVQDQIALRDGSAMRLTIARYFTPKGRSIQREYDNGVEAYHEQYYDRMISEYAHPDSFARKDTAAWGIQPEIYIPHDTSNAYMTIGRLINRGALPTFAYSYYSRNNAEFRNYNSYAEFKREYEVSDELLEKFIVFLKEGKEPFLMSDIRKNSVEVKTALKAYFAKQVYNYEGFYPILNQLDKELLQAYSQVKSIH